MSLPKSLYVIPLTVLSLGGPLSACATAPDPVEVCSTEWIEPRATQALLAFKGDVDSAIPTLKKAAGSYMDSQQIGPFQMLMVGAAMKKLVSSFQNSQGIKDLKTLASTCDDPQLIKKAMTEFLQQEGVDDKMIALMENFQAYQDVINPQIDSLGD